MVRTSFIHTIKHSTRTNPQFNLDALPETLASRQIGHIMIPELGGLRKRSKTISPEVMVSGPTKAFTITSTIHSPINFASACRACGK